MFEVIRVLRDHQFQSSLSAAEGGRIQRLSVLCKDQTDWAELGLTASEAFLYYERVLGSKVFRVTAKWASKEMKKLHVFAVRNYDLMYTGLMSDIKWLDRQEPAGSWVDRGESRGQRKQSGDKVESKIVKMPQGRPGAIFLVLAHSETPEKMRGQIWASLPSPPAIQWGECQ